MKKMTVKDLAFSGLMVTVILASVVFLIAGAYSGNPLTGLGLLIIPPTAFALMGQFGPKVEPIQRLTPKDPQLDQLAS